MHRGWMVRIFSIRSTLKFQIWYFVLLAVINRHSVKKISKCYSLNSWMFFCILNSSSQGDKYSLKNGHDHPSLFRVNVGRGNAMKHRKRLMAKLHPITEIFSIFTNLYCKFYWTWSELNIAKQLFVGKRPIRIVKTRIFTLSPIILIG